MTGWCNGEALQNEPFGVNPHFVEDSLLYDPTVWTQLREVDNGSYSVRLKFNPNGIPYGFIFPVVSSLLTMRQDTV